VGFSRFRDALDMVRLRVRIKSSGCRVASVSGIKIRVSDTVFRVSGFRFRVALAWLRMRRINERVENVNSVLGIIEFRVSGSVFRVSGFGVRGFWGAPG